MGMVRKGSLPSKQRQEYFEKEQVRTLVWARLQPVSQALYSAREDSCCLCSTASHAAAAAVAAEMLPREPNLFKVLLVLSYVFPRVTIVACAVVLMARIYCV